MTEIRIYQLEQENLRLTSQLSLKDEQLERKNERILYLERQLFGRRSEKRLPDNLPDQLSLFDPMQGSPSLPEEKDLLSSLTEEISRKAEQRRAKARHKAATGKRSYQIPAHIERRETIIEPEQPAFPCKMVEIGRDISERLMVEPSKFWMERIIRPVYKMIVKGKEKEDTLFPNIIQAAPGYMRWRISSIRSILPKWKRYSPQIIYR
jgi:hypothetical protein